MRELLPLKLLLKKYVYIYINRGKASGAVSDNPQFPMACARAPDEVRKNVLKSESQKEGESEILWPTGVKNGVLGRSF